MNGAIIAVLMLVIFAGVAFWYFAYSGTDAGPKGGGGKRARPVEGAGPNAGLIRAGDYV